MEAILKEEKIIKQPTALYFCCSIFTIVGLAYYGVKLVLLLFLAENTINGGLGLSAAQASSMVASFLSWAYFSPIIGGWVSDRFIGPKNCIKIGLILVSIGYFIGFFALSESSIHIMIFLTGLGIGFYKSNLHTLVGSLYNNEDPRKDSAFLITYTSTNIGTLIGPFVAGLIANAWFSHKLGSDVVVYGYRYVFLTASIITIIGLLVFTIGDKIFFKDSSIDIKSRKEQIKITLEEKKKLSLVPLTFKEKQRILMILVLAFFTVFFWIAYNQATMSIALYTKEHINLFIGNFEVPTSWIDSYNGLLCVILGPTISYIWIKIATVRKKDVSVVNKMGLGFLILAIAFLFIIGAIFQNTSSIDPTFKASILWIIGFLTFQSIGEICFSPIGYGMVNKLSPQKYVSSLTAVWFLGKFAANKISGYTQAIIDSVGMLSVYITIPTVLIICGSILFLLNKWLLGLTEE